MRFPRRAGVLIHLTALSNEYGIGDLGPSAYDFIDKLKQSKQSYWQILPITQANVEGCPYSSYSAFGGYELLISPEKLVQYGLLAESNLSRFTRPVSKVDFLEVSKAKKEILDLAYQSFIKSQSFTEDFEIFKASSGYWIEDYALFMALTNEYGVPWTSWPEQYQSYSCDSFPSNILEAKEKELFKQFIFHKQWFELKEYANKSNIKMIGDIPIFVAHHSMDVWRNRELFKLGNDGNLIVETGAPPDAFNDLGQKWNNPNYHWDNMKANGFKWWNQRIAYMLDLFDIIRIDHFIGFYNVWEISHVDPDARNGQWVRSPGDELFQSLKKNFPDVPFIAEDLGEINEGTIQLRDKYDLPGMKVIQFGLDNNPDNVHHFSNINEHSVTYTGTHDNNTLNGNLDDILERNNAHELDNLKNFLGKDIPNTVHTELLKLAFESESNTVIVPIQDLVGMRSEGRFNTPGTVKGNWSWRITNDFNQEDAFTVLKDLTVSSQRSGEL